MKNKLYLFLLFLASPSYAQYLGDSNIPVNVIQGTTTWSVSTLPHNVFVSSGSISISGSSNTVQVSNFPSTQNVSIVAPSTVTISGTPNVFVSTVQVVNSTITVINSAGQNLNVTVSNGGFSANGSTIAVVNSAGNNLNVTVSNSGFSANGSTIAVVNSNGSTLNVTAPTLTKKVQGATGLSTQDLKDAGRSYVVLVATGVSGVTSEALFTFQQNKQGVVTSGVTTYTPTNGKTLRIQGLYCSNRDGTTATSWTRATIRHNTAGATVATSPLVFGLEIGDQAALAGAGSDFEAPFPDGIEIFGDGTQTIGVTHLDQATTNLISCTLVGYEY